MKLQSVIGRDRAARDMDITIGEVYLDIEIGDCTIDVTVSRKALGEGSTMLDVTVFKKGELAGETSVLLEGEEIYA